MEIIADDIEVFIKGGVQRYDREIGSVNEAVRSKGPAQEIEEFFHERFILGRKARNLAVHIGKRGKFSHHFFICWSHFRSIPTVIDDDFGLWYCLCCLIHIVQFFRTIAAFKEKSRISQYFQAFEKALLQAAAFRRTRYMERFADTSDAEGHAHVCRKGRPHDFGQHLRFMKAIDVFIFFKAVITIDFDIDAAEEIDISVAPVGGQQI